jgi:hypothetical protein
MTAPSIRRLPDLCAISANWPALTQPVATVTAACIAVFAAAIAYLGVIRTTNTTRRENRRKEKADALVDGLAALQSMVRTLVQVGLTTDHNDRVAMIRDAAQSEMYAAADDWTIANGRLSMYGLDDVLKAAEKFIQLWQKEWAGVVSVPGYPVDHKQLMVDFNAAVPAFKKAMQSLK